MLDDVLARANSVCLLTALSRSDRLILALLFLFFFFFVSNPPVDG